MDERLSDIKSHILQGSALKSFSFLEANKNRYVNCRGAKF
jgi:hypothetical protein